MRRILLVSSILLALLMGFGLSRRWNAAGAAAASASYPARPCGHCRPHPNPDALVPSRTVEVRSTSQAARSKLEPDPWPVPLTQAAAAFKPPVRRQGLPVLAQLPEAHPGPLALSCVLRI